MNPTIHASTVTTVLNKVIQCGIRDFCICPGARNAPFISALKTENHLNSYYFYDERSAAFFALGKAQALQRPVAIITTSGTATSHVFGAVMEAYYTGTPLMVITADRPRRFRHCNPPQSCEQSHLYGIYTKFFIDIADDEEWDLSQWDLQSPSHINVCLEEECLGVPHTISLDINITTNNPLPLIHSNPDTYHKLLDSFLSQIQNPFVIVGKLKPHYREAVTQFLLQLQAPVFLEAISGLREDSRLNHLAIRRTNKLWEQSRKAGYSIDGILRIGGVPTFRMWRDLENMQQQIRVFSLNDVPFSGLSWGPIVSYPIDIFLDSFEVCRNFKSSTSQQWISEDKIYQERLRKLLSTEPQAEVSLIYSLSTKIPQKSLIYLGNSQPIREWDLAATWNHKQFNIQATRGLNGIDGQSSTFLGLCSPSQDNWAIIGDLTALHDLSAPWILPQLSFTNINFTIINNGGGKIFERMFPQKEIQNSHSLHFSSIASFWNLTYEQWKEIPSNITCSKNRLIEIIPDNEASNRLWHKLEEI